MKPISDAPRLFERQRAAYQRHRREYPDALIEQIAAALAEGGVRKCPPAIADLACGTGQLTRRLAARLPGAVVTGLDASRAMIDAASQVAVDAGGGLAPPSRITYITGNAEALPFDEASLDLVTVATGFHWFERSSALREIARVLQPGGVFAAVNITEPRCTPAFRAWWLAQDAGDWRAYRHPALDRYFHLADDAREPALFEAPAAIDLPNRHAFTQESLFDWLCTTSFGSQTERALGRDEFRRRVLADWVALLPPEPQPFEVDFHLFGLLQRRRRADRA